MVTAPHLEYFYTYRPVKRNWKSSSSNSKFVDGSTDKVKAATTKK